MWNLTTSRTCRNALARMMVLLTLCGLYACGPSLRTVERINDQGELANLAIRLGMDLRVGDSTAAHEKRIGISFAAVNKITDQVMLSKVAMEAENFEVAGSAVLKLTDPEAIAKVALNADSWRVRSAAIDRMVGWDVTNPHPLFRLLPWLNKLPSREQRDRMLPALLPVVDLLSYPDVARLLGEIVSVKVTFGASGKERYGPGGVIVVAGEVVRCGISLTRSPLVEGSWYTQFPKIAAAGASPQAKVRATELLDVFFQRIPEPALTATCRKIAVETNEPELQRMAIRKLIDPVDQPLLAKIAVEARNEEVQEAAVQELTDQALLARIVLERRKINPAYKMAVLRLTDQALLFKIATSTGLPETSLDLEEDIRGSAAWGLTDQALLAKIAFNRTDSLRRAAALHLTDQALLARIATRDNDDLAREFAVRGLTDQALLASIAADQKQAHGIRQTASDKITVLKTDDQGALVNLIADRAFSARESAIEKLHDPVCIKAALTLYTDDMLSEYRVKLVAKVSDQALLSRIATEDAQADVRLAAIGRLQDRRLLEKIALEDKHPLVRQEARHRARP